MVIVGVLFNAMSMLAYRIDDIYFSLTLLYGGCLMAANMMWAHEIVHYISMGRFNRYVFSIGILLSLFIIIVPLRQQLFVDDNQWLKRMISHHSTALTTSHNIYLRTKNPNVKGLAKDIIDTQEKEIEIMKSLLH